MPPVHRSRYLLFLPVLVAIIGISVFVASSRAPKYVTVEVKRADITEEVLASGNVASPKTLDLQFQGAGKVITLSVETGNHVVKGTLLSSLDASILGAQREQALSALATQKAQLLSIQEGTRPEEIAVTEAAVANDRIALTQAQQGVIDAIKNAYTVSDSAVKNSLDQLYDNALTNPNLRFTSGDISIKSTVETERSSMGLLLATWLQSTASVMAQSDLTNAEKLSRDNLQEVSGLLADANTALSSANTSMTVSTTQISAWMTAIATARASINTAVTALTTASTAHKSAEARLDGDSKTLALQKAGSTSSSIQAQVAQVQSAQANVSAMDAQIAQTRITAPIEGTITKVNVEVGESISPGTIAISMIPDSRLQIDVNLSEDNVANAHVGNLARITLDAFGPNASWQGTVTKIDPAQTIIGGAVYYKTTVNFDQTDDRVKPGMTANVWLQTGTASSTLVVPASALQSKGENMYVQRQKDGALEDHIVTIGLKSRDGHIQILSGLSEGDTVVTGAK